MSKKFALDRRHLLKGLGGFVLGLPVLETMLNLNGEAFALTGQGLPVNYVGTYGGFATQVDGADPNDSFIENISGSTRTARFDKSLLPIVTRGIKSDVAVVTNLEIPGGGSFHAGNGAGAFLPGIAGTKNINGSNSSHWVVNSLRNSSSDVLCLDLNLKGCYDGENWNGNVKNGKQIRGVRLLTKMYSNLVGGFGNLSVRGPSAVAQAVQTSQALKALKQKKSVLDIVLEDFNRLSKRVSAADNLKLQEHGDVIRKIEQSIASQIAGNGNGGGSGGGGGGSAPDIGKCKSDLELFKVEDDSVSNNYGGEAKREPIIIDLITLALSCGLHSEVFFQISPPKSRLNVNKLMQDIDSANHGDLRNSMQRKNHRDFHEVTHAGISADVGRVLQWDIGVYCNLVKALKEKSMGATTLLDNSVVTFNMDAGYGMGYSGKKARNSHSTENMLGLIAGHGIRGGVHIDAKKQHTAKIYTTAMEAIGLPAKLGDTNGSISGLLG